MKKEHILVAAMAVLVLCVAFLFWQNRELSKSQNLLLMQMQQQSNMSKDGKYIDPYVSGPVKNTITKRASDIQQCYNAFLERKPAKTDGLVVVDWRVDTDGKPIKPEVVSSELNDKEFGACVTSKISQWDFPPPPMEKYVSHRFTFKKQ